MKFSFLKSIKAGLLLLVLVSVLPALGIVIYAGLDRLHSDIEDAEFDALRVVQSLAYEHERVLESTRQFLMTLVRLPDVQNQNASACNKIFSTLLKENPIYTTILATNAEGMVFANSLPLTSYSVKHRKYFQDSLQTKSFSVGEYMIGLASNRQAFSLAYPVMDSKSRIKAVVAAGIDLDRYGKIFTKTKLPKGTVFEIFDHRHIHLYRSHEPEKFLGKTDSPKMIKHMSAQPEEGTFTAIGSDDIKYLYAYKRFYLNDSTRPYLFMRVGIPEAQALSQVRNTLFITIALICTACIMAVVLAWFLGKVIIVRRLDKLVDASQRLGHGDLTARTGLEHSEDELGQVSKAIDEMAEKLEIKESEHRIAEGALRENETKYRTLIETTDTGFVIVDREGRVIDANQEYVRLTGHRNLNEILGRSVIEWTAEYEKKRNAEAVRRCSEEGRVRNLEIDYMDSQGNITPIEINATTVEINGIPQILTLCRDITNRKQAGEKLKRSEAKYRELVENANSIIFRRNRDGNVTFFNEFAQQFFGYTEEEILGKNVIGTIVPEVESNGRDLKRMIEDIGLNPDRYVNNINENMRRNGERVWIAWTNKPILDENGLVKEILCIGNDITERKQAEEALHKSEELYTKLVVTIPDIVVHTDIDGKILFINDVGLQAGGYAVEDLVGHNILSFIAPEDHEKAVNNMIQIFHQKLSPEEYHLVTKDGRKIPFDVNGNILKNEDGSPYGIVFVCRDITERKRIEEARQRLEERLRRAEKMEVLGTLAGGVAHDLNNVLGVLIGYSELLLERVPEENPLRKYAANILQSGQRGAVIIQDLLTLTRRGVAISEVINMNAIVSGYLKMVEFEKLMENHPYVTIRTDLEKDLLNIKGSPVHLEKTLMNLVSNAADAISGNGEITIRTENRYLDRPIQGYDDVKEGDYIVLTVSDNGKGIPAADLEKVFEPFFTKKVMGRSGTGLGLTVVWGTVKDHDGYIDVQSEEDKGTTFVLYFPVTRDELPKDEKSVSPETYMGRGESILVVDDVKEQRELAVTMLSRLGYQVTSAPSGEEAVSYIKTNSVDLLVLDMIMDPGIDGLETYKRILKISPKQKAVIVSGFSETDRVKKTQELGAGPYIRKPYIMQKIGLAVRRELDRPAGTGF